MIKTPLSTVIGGAFWTPGATIIGSTSATLDTIVKSLFSDGTQGIYLNAQDALSVSDLSSIKDLSGRNNHALQANSTSRASLITDPSGYKSLKFDGIDDGYATQSINFTATDKVTVIAAIKKIGGSAAVLCELSADSNISNGNFLLTAPDTTDTYLIRIKGTLGGGTRTIAYPSPHTAVLSANGGIALKTQSININGVVTKASLDTGVGNLGNHPLYIGRRGGTTLPFNGQIYALLVIGKLLDDATTAKIEKEFAKYIGVTL